MIPYIIMPLKHKNVLNAVLPPLRHCFECGFNTACINRHIEYLKTHGSEVTTDAVGVRGQEPEQSRPWIGRCPWGGRVQVPTQEQTWQVSLIKGIFAVQIFSEKCAVQIVRA